MNAVTSLGEAARALVPRLIERAAQADAERRVPAATIAEMTEAGFFRALQPRRWGGSELDLRAFYDVLMTLAEGDMSTAWVFGVLGVAPWVVALLDDRAAADVWSADASARIGLSLAPAGTVTPAEDGVRIGGRWRYASGCDFADWAFLGAIVDPPAQAPAGSRAGWHVLLVPRRDFRVDDTWDSFGLKATGSNDIVVDDAFVPRYRMRRMEDNLVCSGPGQAHNPSALYRLPFGQVFGGGVAFGAIGALDGMLREFAAFARNRVRAGGRATLADADALLAVADAQHAVAESTALVDRNVAALQAYADRNEVPPAHERLRWKFEMATVSERCLQHAARLLAAAGAAGLLQPHRFGRTVADITAACAHVTNQHAMHGRHWGAYLLGEPPPPDPMQ